MLTLNDEMAQHGARPVWLGYLHVEDVDATVAAIKAEGGQVMMPPWDQPGVGRLAMVTDPQGAPFYLMNPIPPEGDPDAGQRRLLRSTSRSMSAGTSCRRSDPDSGGRLLHAATSAGTRKATWIWASMGKYRFVQT